MRIKIARRDLVAVSASFLLGSCLALVFLQEIAPVSDERLSDEAVDVDSDQTWNRGQSPEERQGKQDTDMAHAQEKPDVPREHLPLRRIAEQPAEPEERPICLLHHPELEINRSLRYKHRLIAFNEGRLGNQLFALAATLGIATRSYFLPVLPRESDLLQIFQLNVTTVDAVSTMSWRTYTEQSSYTFDHCTDWLNYETDLRLVGFFHSWRYFHNIQHELKQQLRFLPSIQDKTDRFLQSVKKQYYGDENKSLVTVGIHLRLGDFFAPFNADQGYTVAPPEYLQAAMMYFISTYHPSDLLFVVCSDDMPSARALITALRTSTLAPTVFVDPQAFDLELSNEPKIEGIDSPEVHLRILSLCKHSIITSGSFSWWVGWFSKGTVIYYSLFPLPFSPLEREFKKDDYYPSAWIGIP